MESRSLVATVTLCVLVLVAGCEGAMGDQHRDTPTTTPEPNVAAPGLNNSGITDIDRLTAAHRESLQDRSYTVRTVMEIDPVNANTRYRREIVLKVTANHQGFVLHQNVSGPFPHELTPRRDFDAWSNGNFTYVRSHQEDRPRFQRFETESAPVHADMFTGRSLIKNYLGAVNQTRVEVVRRDGWIAYEINTVGKRFQPYAITTVIDTFGLMHELTVQYPIDTQFGEAILTYRVTYSGVGTTTVDQPFWVTDARKETSVLTSRPLCTGDQSLAERQC